jgi:hypothetical protein
MTCKVGGCSNPILEELEDTALCLSHFLDDIQERARNFNRRLAEPAAPETALLRTALQFTVLAAAKIAAVGVNNPPQDELTRGRLLNGMLLLADLRERVERQLVN